MKKIANHYLEALETSIIASDEIMRIYQTSYHKNIKSDGSPVTDADMSSSEIISNKLQESRIPIISEEELNTPFQERKNWTDVWIVDPLDGTKEFIKKNGEFAVNIALVSEGEPVFGLIASPVNRTILFGGVGIGSYITEFSELRNPSNWKPLTAKEINNPVVLACSRAPYPDGIIELIDSIKRKREVEFIKKGSALKFFDLADGHADVYPRFAPTMEWDIAAGHAILLSMGGTIVDAETGQPLTYNKESLFNPSFIAKTKGYINFYG